MQWHEKLRHAQLKDQARKCQDLLLADEVNCAKAEQCARFPQVSFVVASVVM